MNKIIIHVAKSDHEFIGIICKNEIMHITFPIGYHIKEKTIHINDKQSILSIKNDTIKLLELLEKNQDITYHLDNNKFSYSTANYLINDYFNHNLYQEKIHTNSKLNNGLINWKQTIESTLPIYSTGNIIYTNPINRNIELRNNHITEIQIYCLNIAFSILGIFYNNVSLPPSKIINEKESIYLLTTKLSQTNQDREKKLITNLIQFIKGTSLNKTGDQELKIGTTYFHTIWEKHLKTHITKIYPSKEFLPKAYYISNNTKINTSSQKPDIIVESKKYLYLIDAKYYKIDNLPQSSDINKQLCYATYISKRTNKKIMNLFLLPNQISNSPNYEYFGYATSDNFENLNGGKIHTYYLDTKTLLNFPNNILNHLIQDNFNKIKRSEK